MKTTSQPVPHKLLAACRELNKAHAVVQVCGTTKVMKEGYDSVLQRKSITYSSPTDFKQFRSHLKYSVPDPNETVKVSLGDYWFGWEQRRQYEGVLFDPSGKAPAAYFNLWRGFSVEPVEGEWSLFHEHVFDNICNGNSEHYEYLMAWLAQGVQHPETRPDVALVLKSEGKGTGKSIFARYYRELFGPHGMTVSNPNQVLGRFNDHLEDTICLVLEEAFWTGIRTHESNLKAYITEDTLSVEGKGLPTKTVRNYLRIIMLSNNEWVVPASADERRYLVLDVNDQHKQDTKYFGAIADQMENGGLAAMLYDLKRHNYSAVDLRIAPKTESLTEQKILSLDAKHKWWFEKLCDGCLHPGAEWGEITKQELGEDYVGYMSKTRNRNDRSSETELGMFLTRMFGSKLANSRPRRKDGSRPPTWTFPSLEECRMLFDLRLGMRYPWPKDTGRRGLKSVPQIAEMPK